MKADVLGKIERIREEAVKESGRHRRRAIPEFLNEGKKEKQICAIKERREKAQRKLRGSSSGELYNAQIAIEEQVVKRRSCTIKPNSECNVVNALRRHLDAGIFIEPEAEAREPDKTQGHRNGHEHDKKPVKE